MIIIASLFGKSYDKTARILIHTLLLTVVYTACIFAPAAAQMHKNQNIVIVTLDGMRWQEIFGGIDSAIMNNPTYTGDMDNLKGNFWADDTKERRKKLFPFLWGAIEQQGQLYGNRNVGNKVDVANPYHFSYPGYNEMFTGFPDTAVNSNDKKLNKNINVLEFINKQRGYNGKVAAFTTWDLFPYILNQPRSGLYINSDTDTLAIATPAAVMINNTRLIAPRPLGCRPDLITYLSARAYLTEKKPKALFISFLETDYAAHNGMYDVYITSAHAEDAMIADLWNTLQSMPGYKNKTTLIITCDHGRGDNPKKNWTSHGGLYDSGAIWIAVIGPDASPKGEVTTNTQLYQKQLAPTIAKLLGFQFVPKAGYVEPINTIVP